MSTRSQPSHGDLLSIFAFDTIIFDDSARELGVLRFEDSVVFLGEDPPWVGYDHPKRQQILNGYVKILCRLGVGYAWKNSLTGFLFDRYDAVDKKKASTQIIPWLEITGIAYQGRFPLDEIGLGGPAITTSWVSSISTFPDHESLGQSFHA